MNAASTKQVDRVPRTTSRIGVTAFESPLKDLTHGFLRADYGPTIRVRLDHHPENARARGGVRLDCTRQPSPHDEIGVEVDPRLQEGQGSIQQPLVIECFGREQPAERSECLSPL